MPKAYPSYPYIETVAANLTEAEIAQVVEDMLSQNPRISLRDGGPLDRLCQALNVDLEYSGPPSEVLLDVPMDGRAVIWLPKRGKPRQDRLTVATGIGHWLLHVPPMLEKRHDVGIQALYNPKNKDALREAQLFAFDLLMPEDRFKEVWFEGRAALTAEVLNVPTQAVYDRAKWLDLSESMPLESKVEEPPVKTAAAPESAPAAPPLGGYARRIG